MKNTVSVYGWIILVILTAGVSSQLPPGPIDIVSPPRRRPPCDARDRPILGPRSARSCGPYPADQIAKFLKSSATNDRSVSAASQSSSCFCKRVLPISTIVSRSKRDTLIPRGKWEDSCPARPRTYMFPTCISHFRQKCWVLRPWVNLRCPYKSCRFRKCRNVNPIQPKAPIIRISQCRHTNRRTIRFYIWCPRSRKVFPRTVSLPQCCSCSTRLCFPFIT